MSENKNNLLLFLIKGIKILLIAIVVIVIAFCGAFIYQIIKSSLVNYKETEVIDIGTKDDFYRLYVPGKFMVNNDDRSNKETLSLASILYPEMVPMVNYDRHNKDELMGVNKRTVSLHLTYYAEDQERYLNNIPQVMIKNTLHKNYVLSNDPNNKLLKKYPNIKLYVNKLRGNIKYPGANDVKYVFTTKDNQMAIASCTKKIPKKLYDLCKVRASWEGKFDITYYLPLRFFYNMVDFNQDVYDLVTSFNPTYSSELRNSNNKTQVKTN